MSEEKPKRLSGPEFYKACQHLAANAERYMKERPSVARTAEMLARELGFAIPGSAVNSIREATGVSWKAKQAHGERKGKMLRRYQAMQLQIDRLTAGVAQAIVLIDHLYRKLGEEKPKTWIQEAIQQPLDKKAM